MTNLLHQRKSEDFKEQGIPESKFSIENKWTDQTP